MPPIAGDAAGQPGRALTPLVEKLSSRSATICGVGLGYVGLPLLLRFAEEGYRAIGIDVDERKLVQLTERRSYIGHIASSELQRVLGARFSCSRDIAAVADADAIVLCLPTPLNKHCEPDLSYVTATCDAIAPHLRAGQVISLESTTYPGTTEEELVPRLARSGLEVGRELFVVYSPEREDPGNLEYTTQTIPKLVAGHTKACLSVGLALYGQIIDRLVSVRSTRVAELSKLLENIQRAVNIALMNEMKGVCDAMGEDVFEVIDAAATKPFGFTPYYPGPGLGGHCIPVDPFYLTWKAREFGVDARFIELAGEVNRNMPNYVFGKLVEALGTQGKALAGAQVLVLGLAYKKNVDDVRESPAIELMEIVRDKGGVLAYSDPHVPSFPKMRKHHFPLRSLALTPAVLSEFDAVVLCTDHTAFDYPMIREHSSLVVDTRGVYPQVANHVVRA